MDEGATAQRGSMRSFTCTSQQGRSWAQDGDARSQYALQRINKVPNRSHLIDGDASKIKMCTQPPPAAVFETALQRKRPGRMHNKAAVSRLFGNATAQRGTMRSFTCTSQQGRSWAQDADARSQYALQRINKVQNRSHLIDAR